MRIDRIWEFLQRFSPLTRSCLLTELERLELCGIDMPGSADLQAKLRAELRPDGAADNTPTPSRYFFAPLEPLLVDGAPEHANPGRMARSSLVPIWEWICREPLAQFGAALPENILKFDDAQVGKVTALLDAFRKKDPDAVPFALALVAGRLKTPRELMCLATKAARGRTAADVAATPYAIAVSMVLDQIDDKRVALRVALMKNRVVVARDILAEIDSTES